MKPFIDLAVQKGGQAFRHPYCVYDDRWLSIDGTKGTWVSAVAER